MKTTKMIVLKNARLEGRDVVPGEEIDLPDTLIKYWQKKGLAKAVSKKPDTKTKRNSGKGAGPVEKTDNKDDGNPIDYLKKLNHKKLLALALKRGLDVPGNPSKKELVSMIEEKLNDEKSETEKDGSGESDKTANPEDKETPNPEGGQESS